MQEQILKEQQRTNELLEKIINQYKDPNELLDINQVCKEFNMGMVKARKVFKDPELPVQRYTKKHTVTRRAMQEYVSVNHDYLKEGA